MVFVEGFTGQSEVCRQAQQPPEFEIYIVLFDKISAFLCNLSKLTNHITSSNPISDSLIHPLIRL